MKVPRKMNFGKPRRRVWALVGAVICLACMPMLLVVPAAIGNFANVGAEGDGDEMPMPLEMDDTRIAFTSNCGGPLELYTVNPDGTDLRQLTDTQLQINSWLVDSSTNWSPDGSRIAFSTGTHIATAPYIAGSGTVTVNELTTNGPQGMERLVFPNWTANGERIVFSAIDDDSKDVTLYSIGTDGSGLQEHRRIANLTQRTVKLTLPGGGYTIKPEINGWHMDLSPDGTRIAYIELSGSGKIHIADVEDVATEVIETGRVDIRGVKWSPDGLQLAFYGDAIVDSTNRIYTINADGSNLREVRALNRSIEDSLHWSPEGTYLLVASGNRLFAANLLNGDWHRIITIGGRQLNGPSWSPVLDDGQLADASGIPADPDCFAPPPTTNMDWTFVGFAIFMLSAWFPVGAMAPVWLLRARRHIGAFRVVLLPILYLLVAGAVLWITTATATDDSGMFFRIGESIHFYTATVVGWAALVAAWLYYGWHIIGANIRGQGYD